jgi:hypothetical protein
MSGLSPPSRNSIGRYHSGPQPRRSEILAAAVSDISEPGQSKFKGRKTTNARHTVNPAIAARRRVSAGL